MSIGVGFDDGEQLDLRAGEGCKKTIVIFERAGADFDPAWARLHWIIQFVHDQFMALMRISKLVG